MPELIDPADLPDQINARWLGPCGFNPFHKHVSSARAQMHASHLGQMLVINKPTVKNIQTGVEREYGKYTFRVEMPVDARIITTIERYSLGIGYDSIRNNPETIVIYEDVVTKEVGILKLVEFSSNHQYFGFKYAKRESINELYPGAYIPKGTVFLDSTSISDEGDYMYGVNANVAYMSLPGVSEDGLVVSKDFLPKMGFKIYETRVLEYGKNTFALNTYGDDEHYKAYPDIGEYIRPDGLLAATRQYDPDVLSIVEQNLFACQQVDFTFDQTIYVNGPGGKIVDIKIHHDKSDYNNADVHMDGQSQKYDNARRVFCRKVLEEYDKLKKLRGDSLQITPEFNQLIVNCLFVNTQSPDKQKIQALHRNVPLDIFRIEFTIEYEVEPTIGFKSTESHGSKGVICQVMEPEHMPVDANGVRADIVMDPNSVINRANPGRLYEHYLNSACWKVFDELCKFLNVEKYISVHKAQKHLDNVDDSTAQRAFDYLLKFYEIVSPNMRVWFDDGTVITTPKEYLAEIIHIGVGLYIPTDNPVPTMDIITQIEALDDYRPIHGPVTYVGNSGQRVTTESKVRIGQMYFILLEKTGDDWSAVSSGKVQHHAVLAPLTKIDKHAKPARQQAVRAAGEAEIRVFISNTDPHFVPELMDRNNNPKTHKLEIESILSAEKPGNIDRTVDRTIQPLGGSKPLQLLKHHLQIAGVEFGYKPFDPNKG